MIVNNIFSRILFGILVVISVHLIFMTVLPVSIIVIFMLNGIHL